MILTEMARKIMEAEAAEEATEVDSPLGSMSPNISPPSLLLPAPLWAGTRFLLLTVFNQMEQ